MEIKPIRKMLRDRRGLEMAAEAGPRLAIVVLVVVVIILISANIIISLKSASSFEACQKSISIAHDNRGAGNVRTWFMSGKYYLDCTASRVVITFNDAVREADKIGRDDMPEEGVKSLLAGEMVRCWRMVGKGDFNPYGSQNRKEFCLICSVVDFGDELQSEGSFSGFHLFLARESAKIDGDEQQYSNFFFEGWNDPEKVDDSINMSRPYAVFWYRGKIGVGQGDSIPEGKTYVGLLPYDSIVEDRCEFVVN